MNKFVSIFLTLAAFAVTANAQAASCFIDVPSDLTQPMTFDKTLWSGTFAADDLHFLIAKDLSAATAITEDQSNDKNFLSQHQGEVAVAIALPYPGDKTAGDVLLALSTIDTTQENNRSNWINSVGNLNIQSSGAVYGLDLSDYSRHVVVNCR